jgi:hypothetical protein
MQGDVLALGARPRHVQLEGHRVDDRSSGDGARHIEGDQTAAKKPVLRLAREEVVAGPVAEPPVLVEHGVVLARAEGHLIRRGGRAQGNAAEKEQDDS